MTHRTISFLILTLGIIPTSCSILGSSSSVSETSSSSSECTGSECLSSSEVSSSSVEESVEEQTEEDYRFFWQPDTVLNFSLSASYASLKGIQDAYYSSLEADDEYYYSANLVVTMTIPPSNVKTFVLNNVGIRMKGNTSRTDFMDEEGSLYDLIHYKISFDAFVPDRRFLGMKKLDIKWNKNYDATQIKQAYSYKMFEALGVYAPKSTITPLTLSITNLPGGGSTTNQLGLYQVIEAIDKTFIQRRFPESEAGGNLYKCTWGAYDGNWTGSDLLSQGAVSRSGSTYVRTANGRIGIETPDIGYYPNYKLKTNETAADFSDLATLIGVLNSTTDYSNAPILTTINRSVNLDNFLRYEAISYLLGDPDDTRNNYNNYYLYFAKTSGKAYFIPFDFDRCLGITKDWNPSGDAMTSVSPFSDQAMGNYSAQRNPLYKFTILSGGSATLRQNFATYLAQYVTSEWFTTTFFDSIYDQYYDSYGGQEDVSFNNVAFPYYASWGLNESGDGSGTEMNLSFENYRNAKYATVANALEATYPDLLD